ncbi:MAG: uridine diphosphate-N-acetylglucosamine-binding protein YvcK [Frankiaceae bacterium]|nr:uridine diphosphate-N-acetylglucosamine-binding protein YvcK [Frankiaceae bacterium]MBV9872349.1 uridine diphosphate-N-acetylglucosamine-binding protein YvcK [Frankiaceae bacterium]
MTDPNGPKVVAFGGGHGLSASLAALRRVTANLTAVVTVADDGGSSGVIRDELDALPPGDLRMALAALAGDDSRSRLWADVCQYRFGGDGTLAGHPVGNLLLTGLSDVTGDPVAALDLVAELLGAVGRVLPLSVNPIDIVADVVGLDPADRGQIADVRGQVAVATTPGQVVGVRLDPESVDACPQAVEAVLDADWVVFGPGSWFTSVIPHLLVPDMLKALTMTHARRVVTLNMSPQVGETEGFSPETHLEVLGAHAPDLQVDVVLAPRRALYDATALEKAAQSLGAELVVAHLGNDQSIPTHDPQRLATAYRSIFSTDRTHTKGDSAWQ